MVRVPLHVVWVIDRLAVHKQFQPRVACDLVLFREHRVDCRVNLWRRAHDVRLHAVRRNAGRVAHSERRRQRAEKTRLDARNRGIRNLLLQQLLGDLLKHGCELLAVAAPRCIELGKYSVWVGRD